MAQRDALEQLKGDLLSKPELRIHLLGSFRVWVGQDLIPESAWRRRKAASLVKLLALSPHHSLHREEVLESLWPDLSPEAAQNNLHRTLHIVRHALEPDLSPGARSALFRLQGELLVLSPDWEIRVDVDAFVEAADGARRRYDPARYETAIRMYTEDLLPEDRYEDWTAVRRDELRRVYHDLLRRLSHLYVSDGNRARAIELLQLLVASEPSEEGAHTELMRLYILNGHRSEALSQYQRLTRALSQDLDAEPEPETTRLYTDILAGRLPSGMEEQRSSSAGTDARAVRDNLPSRRSSFIGRIRELADVRHLLSTTRLVTLTGAGGVGKSRLAETVAGQLSAAYPDGVHFVQLGMLTTPDLVLHSVASALGVHEQADQPIMHSLRSSLRAARLLLVLDNCEHLIGACSHLAEELLEACPGIGILATSRRPLLLPGEVAWRVPSLTLPRMEPLPSIDTLLQHDAIRLFVERATESRPEFVLDPMNAGELVELCRRLDGIPLAIELAAARMKVMTVDQLLARLDDCFSALGGSTSPLPRHQTLQATLDWSYALLNEEEQALFQRLSVFAGGWTLEAAEDVCGREEIERRAVLDLLSRLVDHSLVVVEPHGTTLRFRFLEPIRQYAVMKVKSAQEQHDIHCRHAKWCMERVERAQADFEGPEHAQWLEHLDTERENMRTALAWLFTTGCVREAQRMCTALWEWWWMRGHLAEGARWLQLVLEADPDERTAARADVLSAAANLIRYQGDQRRAEGLYQESLTLNRELGNIAGIANVVSNLGYLAQERGDYEEARCLFLEGHAIRRRLGDTRLIAASLNNLAGVAMVQEDYARAEPLYDECLRLNQEASDSWWVAHTLFNLGLVALGQNHPDRAEQRFRQSLEMTCNLGYSLGILWALEGVAGVAAAQGQPEWAAQLWGATDSWRHQGSTPRTPSEERRIQRQMRVARVQVDHAIWTVAWEKGRAMSLEEAAREALHRGSKRPHSEPTTLTAREGEVAKMVALGFTNREIAAQLALSERTIDAHVSSILKKLGARSRSEIAGLCGQRDSTTASMPKATS